MYFCNAVQPRCMSDGCVSMCERSPGPSDKQEASTAYQSHPDSFPCNRAIFPLRCLYCCSSLWFGECSFPIKLIFISTLIAYDTMLGTDNQIFNDFFFLTCLGFPSLLIHSMQLMSQNHLCFISLSKKAKHIFFKHYLNKKQLTSNCETKASQILIKQTQSSTTKELSQGACWDRSHLLVCKPCLPHASWECCFTTLPCLEEYPSPDGRDVSPVTPVWLAAVAEGCSSCPRAEVIDQK